MIEKSRVPVFILAGGMGTRISEETHLKPKPMIEVGDIPILVHIMRYYYSYGFNDFVICAGYRAWDIKEYFINYNARKGHVDLDNRESGENDVKFFGSHSDNENWRVRVIDTGLNTMTGARVGKAIDAISGDTDFEHFAVTYGDGVCDVDLEKEFNFHLTNNKIGTVTAVSPSARFGMLDLTEDKVVKQFMEKPEEQNDLINGGFFFFKSEFKNYLSRDKSCILERTPLEKLAKSNELVAFEHSGFWQCMDTLRDKNLLQDLWDSGKPPWLRQNNI